MNDVELLREAARRMRTLSQAATPGADPLPGGWAGFGANTDREGQAAMFAGPAENGYRMGTVFSFDEHCQSCTPPTDADVQHMAGWSPAAAVAVADWLDAAASGHQYLPPRRRDVKALTVARAYLGVES